MSLRVRLLVATGIVVLVALVGVGAVTYALVTRSQITQMDAALARAHSPAEQLAATGDPASWALIPDIAPGLFIAIVGPDGSVAYTSPARVPGGEPIVVDVSSVDLGVLTQTVDAENGQPMRLRVDAASGGWILIVGDSLHEVTETSSRLLLVLLAASGAAILVVLGVAWWLISVGLRPLTAVEASAAMISDDSLGDRRVPGAEHRTEVGSLARALNAMLGRLDAAREERERTMEQVRASEARMRQFVADASHELRTPVAATAAYAELFEKGARDHPSDLERSMNGIRAETERMGRLVDDLLLLARLDEHRPLSIERVDLTEIALAAIDAARILEPERPFHPAIGEVVMVDGDPIRLRQVVDNILGNVRKHTPVDAPCDISLTVDGDEAVLVVSDRGPGVTDEQRRRLRDRFYRVDDARTRSTGGSGLGLSIVDAIITAHGGSMDLAPNDGGGLVVTVRLPHGSTADAAPDESAQ